MSVIGEDAVEIADGDLGPARGGGADQAEQGGATIARSGRAGGGLAYWATSGVGAAAWVRPDDSRK